MKLRNLETIGEPTSSGSFYPNFQSIPLNVSYDADAYRSFVQEVRNVRNSLNTLPPNVREQVRGMLQKVVQGTLDAQKVIYDSLIDPKKIKGYLMRTFEADARKAQFFEVSYPARNKK